MKNREPVWSTAARADLVEDHNYIARENPMAADRFFLDLYRKIETFARDGLTGVDRSELGNGIRSFAYRERAIFFQLSEAELIILRVAHGHQDISSEYFKNSEN